MAIETPSTKRIATERSGARIQTWFHEESSAVWHARDVGLSGDRVRALCGEVIQLGNRAREIRHMPAARCSTCFGKLADAERSREEIRAETELQILEDLLDLATASSRSLERIRSQIDSTIDALPDASPRAQLRDLVLELVSETAALCAVLVPSAATRAHTVALVVSVVTTHVEDIVDADEVSASTFEEAGLAHDFMPWRERFPDYEEHEAEDR